MLATDPFDLLGLPPDASREAVRRAYRKLAMRWHPDRNPHSHEAEARFKEIKAAHDLALDPDAYQAWRADRATSTDSAPDPATPLEAVLNLTLEAAAHGGRHTVRVGQSCPCTACDGRGRIAQAHSVPCPACRGVGRLRGSHAPACPGCAGRGYVRELPCATCDGEGQRAVERVFSVRVPAGVRSGDTLRLTQTDASVLVRIAIDPHPFFTLHEDDLHCRVPIDPLTRLAGGTLTVPTLAGLHAVSLPPSGVTDGTHRLPGLGYPRRGGRGAGDLVLAVQVIDLQDLTADERSQLQALAASLGRHARRCAPAVHAWQAAVAAHAAGQRADAGD